MRAHQPSLAKGVPPSVVLENCALPRVMKPLEDVCTHIELQRKYWANLKAMMVREVAARGRSYWGWTEEEWIESIRKGGHEKPSVAAVGYLLCGFEHRISWGARASFFMVVHTVSSAANGFAGCSPRSRSCLSSVGIVNDPRESMCLGRCARS